MLLLGVLAAQAEGAVGVASDYDLIETESIGTAVASVTFTSGGVWDDYEHLQIRMVTRTARVSFIDSIKIQFNGDTGSNYLYHSLRGDGTSVISYDALSRTSIALDSTSAANSMTDAFGAHIVDILDFANTSKNTTVRSLGGVTSDTSGESELALASGLWLNTAAVTSVTVLGGNGNLAVGSRISIFGLKVA